MGSGILPVAIHNDKFYFYYQEKCFTKMIMIMMIQIDG